MNALFTRLVRRRNFAGFPFLVSASTGACDVLSARAREYAASQGFDAGARLCDLSPDDIGAFRERGMLPEQPVTFAGQRDYKLLFTRPDGGEHALFGEVEHWTRVQVVAGLPGANANAATTPPNPASEIPFARSPAYGFLTSNPAHAGTGLQIEAALHLPALAADRRPGQGLPAIQELQRALGALGYELQPLSLRTPGSAESGYFKMTSRGMISGGGTDFPEERQVELFRSKAERVLDLEKGALLRWQQRDPNRLEDSIFRALRLLQEARRMEYAELVSLTSYARIGVYFGLFPSETADLLETLRTLAQPFLLGKTLGGGPDLEAGPQSPEPARAALARRLLAGIEPL